MQEMSNEEKNTKSALQLLMQNAKRVKKKHSNNISPRREQSCFFPCPAGCGRHVTERDVNVHLDKFCSVMNDGDCPAARPKANNDAVSPAKSGNSLDKNQFGNTQSVSTPQSEFDRTKSNVQSPYSKAPVSVKRKANSNTQQKNAFSHMMKQSAKVFNSSEITAKHKFHLHHDKNGRITTTWISDQIDATIAMDDIVWSATVSVKKIKSIPFSTVRKFSEPHEVSQELAESRNDATSLELEVTSSIPFQQTQQDVNDSCKFNFVQKHSRLSVRLIHLYPATHIHNSNQSFL
jgi:hypothetical protein